MNTGLLANPGVARTAPPRTQTVIGQHLVDYLGALRGIAPKDNPRGRWIADLFLSGPEEMAARMAAGDRRAVFDTRPNSRLVNPQLLETIGVFPAATAVKTPQALIAPAVSAGVGLLAKAAKVPSGDTPSLWDALTPAMIEPRTGLLSMTGYHGTPHRFPPTETIPLGEFDLQKIGTGEGAQAFGHGIYVAEHPDTAKTYARSSEGAYKRLSGHLEPKVERAYDYMDRGMSTMDTVGEMSKVYPDASFEEISDAIDEARALVPRDKSLYEVDIPDEVIDNQMLDWDKPLSEQSEAVRRALEGFKLPRDQLEPGRQAGQAGWQLYDKETGYLDTDYSFSSEKEAMDFLENPTGSDIYNLLSGGNDPAMAAEVSSSLRSKGISGIKYKDAASRGGEGGTRNFVLFDPDVATITARNGETLSKADKARLLPDELPMDTASRMQRAKEMGFDVDNPMYHATNAENIKAFDLEKIGTQTDSGFYGEGIYFADTPGEAGYYAKNVGKYVVGGKILDLGDLGVPYDDKYLGSPVEFKAWAKKLDSLGLLDDVHKKGLETMERLDDYVSKNIRILPAKNKDGCEGFLAEIIDPSREPDTFKGKTYYPTISSRVDNRGNYPATKEAAIRSAKNNFIDEQKYENARFKGLDDLAISLSDYLRLYEGGPKGITEKAKKAGYDGIKFGSETVIFDPKNIRKPEAKFDPKKVDSKDLLSGRGLLNVSRAV